GAGGARPGPPPPAAPRRTRATGPRRGPSAIDPSIAWRGPGRPRSPRAPRRAGPRGPARTRAPPPPAPPSPPPPRAASRRTPAGWRRHRRGAGAGAASTRPGTRTVSLPATPIESRGVRRVLLISNANAHTVTPYTKDVIARALAAGSRLQHVETERRG